FPSSFQARWFSEPSPEWRSPSHTHHTRPQHSSCQSSGSRPHTRCRLPGHERRRRCRASHTCLGQPQAA
uniref:Uncharacterized protein n=1 Tax=Cyprinus carpio TaxID=7962 RepID=A0A8C2HM63_CYPCA